MGVLNVTPDSFSDGGRFRDAGPALARARELVDAGADLLDVGGESTRPGAEPVSPEEEMERILPVILDITGEMDVPVSVDTRHAEVARAAMEAGAQVVNDVSGLADRQMAATVAEFGAGLVLMHMRGTPATMQSHTTYGDVAGEVAAELLPRIARARAAGIGDACIVLDPGIGFAKTAEQNLELIARLHVLAELGFPLLLGASRKAFIGHILGGIPADERDAGTVGACVAGLARGARIFRVHHVRGARQALDVAWSILRIPAEAA
ncbi:MAG: dihydropteroate synthase [Gemmatimonadetes bacterium]|nr:dihydropteroate synthase [Gemmatimonadota bacterium]